MPSKIIIEPHYWPSLSAVAACIQSYELQLDMNYYYYKRSYINRCRIHGPNGVQLLTIPLVKGKHQGTPIAHLRIAYHQPWQDNHLRSIRAAYGSAPYFDHYIDEVEQFYKDPVDLLADLLWRQYMWIIEQVGREYQLSKTETYVESFPNDFYDARSKFQLRSTQQNFPSYSHVWDDRSSFISDLSFLDALFHLGPSLSAYLDGLSVASSS